MEVKCCKCGKSYAGDAERLARARSCPNCRHQGEWWVPLVGNDVLAPKLVPTKSRPRRPRTPKEKDLANEILEPRTKPQVNASAWPVAGEDRRRYDRQLAARPVDPRDREIRQLRAQVDDVAERNNRTLQAIIAFLLCGPVGFIVLFSDSRRPTNWVLVLVIIGVCALVALVLGLSAQVR